jgi:hypothetical protein
VQKTISLNYKKLLFYAENADNEGADYGAAF